MDLTGDIKAPFTGLMCTQSTIGLCKHRLSMGTGIIGRTVAWRLSHTEPSDLTLAAFLRSRHFLTRKQEGIKKTSLILHLFNKSRICKVCRGSADWLCSITGITGENGIIPGVLYFKWPVRGRSLHYLGLGLPMVWQCLCLELSAPGGNRLPICTSGPQIGLWSAGGPQPGGSCLAALGLMGAAVRLLRCTIYSLTGCCPGGHLTRTRQHWQNEGQAQTGVANGRYAFILPQGIDI
jgi:hypothetical protein